MATQTTNLKLIKPDYTDTVDIAAFNQNADIIDSKINTLSPLASPVFTGTPLAPTGTDYLVTRIRNMSLVSVATVGSIGNGNLEGVYG